MVEHVFDHYVLPLKLPSHDRMVIRSPAWRERSSVAGVWLF